uniref:ApaG domain-containing protein n=1 Tax=Trypanosoma congolense (strain IL3000) TaxID=1068625 RepID=G0UPH3_TRYCI|nr:conserved hypothetical protein [Trypanosoma congolense IL3000]
MSVVCHAYRQVLKHLRKSSVKYDKQRELCFAVFGLMLDMDDFAAAGYGHTPMQVARAMFSRPYVAGLPKEEYVHRLSASFDSLRRLAELSEAVSAEGRRNNNKVDPGECLMTQGSSAKSMKETPATAPTYFETVEKHSESGTKVIEEIEGSRPSEEVAEVPISREEDMEAESEIQDGDQIDSDFSVDEGVVYIQRSVSRMLPKFFRRIITCKNQGQMPPYRYILPPEPMYPKTTRVSFNFPLMTDAMICMAASALGGIEAEGYPVAKRDILTSEDYVTMRDAIPTKTVTVTDHVEVELRTEYVFSGAGGDLCSYSKHMPVHSADEGKEMKGYDVNGTAGRTHVFRYFVFIRNYGPEKNEKKWYVQLFSRHWVFFDEESGTVVEVVGPGVVGNFPLLAPGESHLYESGVSLRGSTGVMRGTFQVNVYNESGESRCIDIQIAPTRLSRKTGVD